MGPFERSMATTTGRPEVEELTNKPVTAIVAYEVSAEDAERFLDSWHRAQGFMKDQPGLMSTKLHKAVSAAPDFRFVNVTRWENPDAFRSATQSQGFQEASGRLSAFSIHAAVYEVVAT
jgi:heme-degrading monooxygenase HmoA